MRKGHSWANLGGVGVTSMLVVNLGLVFPSQVDFFNVTDLRLLHLFSQTKSVGLQNKIHFQTVALLKKACLHQKPHCLKLSKIRLLNQ